MSDTESFVKFHADSPDTLADLAEFGPPAKIRIVPCVDGYGGDTPYAKVGICSVCGCPVDTTRIREDSPNVYSHRAVPHTRQMRWYLVAEPDLVALVDYQNTW